MRRLKFSNKLPVLLLSVLFTVILACYSYFAIHELMEFNADGPFYTFCILGWVSLAWAIASWAVVRHEILCPYIIFLVFFYLFTYGQCFIWTFGITTGIYDLQRDYLKTELIQTQAFTLLSLNLFHIGALVAARRIERKPNGRRPSRALNAYNPNEPSTREVIRTTGLIVFVISVVPFVFESYRMLQVALESGYRALYSDYYAVHMGFFERMLRRFSDLLLPSIICLFTVSKGRRERWMLLIVALLKAGVEIVLGGRGATVAMLVCLVCLWHYTVRPFTARRMIPFAIGGYGMVMLFSGIGAIRNQTHSSLGEFIGSIFTQENLIVRAFSELGMTMSAMLMTSRLVPASYPFRGGSTYLYALTALLPNLGFWSVHPAEVNAGMSHWLQEVMHLNYGPGYSMVAEGYINFGWGGVFAMLVYGLILGTIFTIAHRSNWQENPIGLCVSLIFLNFFLVHGTRGNLLDIVREPVYAVLLFVILFGLSRFFLRRRYRRSKWVMSSNS